jgi:hypothetical protein
VFELGSKWLWLLVQLVFLGQLGLLEQ